MPVQPQYIRPIPTGGRTSVPGAGGLAGLPGKTTGNQANPFAQPEITNQGMDPASQAAYDAARTGGGGTSSAMSQYLRDSAATKARQAAENAAASASASINVGGAGAGGGTVGAGGVGQVAAPGVPGGTNAAMLRAKDRVGQLSRGALGGLRSSLAERGLLGSGVEGRATAGLAEAGLGELADVSREQAIKESDLASKFAELGYQGAITQRGQDITMRGQDIQAQQAAAGRAQSTYQQTLQAMMDALRSQVY